MVDFVDELGNSTVKPGLEETAFFAWGAVDPEGCFEAVRQRKASVRRSALDGMADTDVEKAAVLALRMPNAQFALGGVAGRGSLSEESVQKFLARSVYDGSRQPLLNSLVTRLAESDPAAAVEQARRNGRIWNDQVAAAISEITRHDPAAAVVELQKLPESRSRAISSVELAKTWASGDPRAALEWARAELRPTVLKMALLEIASTIGGRDPAAGLALFGEIGWENVGDFYMIETVAGGEPNSSERYRYSSPDTVAAALLKQLATEDREAALEFVGTTPDEVQKRLIEKSGMGGIQ